MRTQLENIERAEKYLNNELTTTERELFEQELTTNSELKTLTEDIQNVRTAVFRNELRKKIESNVGGGGSWGKAGIIGVIIVGICVLIWLFVPNPIMKEQPASMDQKETAQVAIAIQAEPTKDTVVNVVAVSRPKLKKPVKATLVSNQNSDGPTLKFSLGGHELWSEPDVQTFRFDCENGATIEGKDGMLVIVPSNAFVDAAGKVISGEVEFKLVEALGIEQMVLYKLKTVSNGSPLESGGMFYTEATAEGKTVQINPKRPLYIEIPTTEKKDGMMVFKGEVDENGNLDWVDPKPLKKYLVKIPLNDLDFLPTGFETEVQGNMPFLNYNTTSKSVTDSLYYSLRRTESEPNFGEPLRDKRQARGDTTLRKRRKGDLTESNTSTNRAAIETVCGIDPPSIESIKTKMFANTFVATKEFEERVRSLHQIENGDELLQLYVNNLSKDLWVADSLAAINTDAAWKERFRSFANEHLTNIKDADLYQKRLSDYYVAKRKELETYHKKLATELASKNTRELKQIVRELSESDNRNPLFSQQGSASQRNTDWSAPVPRISAATSQVYATPWSAGGWGNIDKYFKLLNNGTIEVPITVSNLMPQSEVTQWLTQVNTYTNLSEQNGQFKAVFPKKAAGSKSTTHVFAIAESGREFTWGMKRFDPYKDSTVEFEMATASIADIKQNLGDIDAVFGRIRQQLLWKQEQAKRLIIDQTQAKQKQEEWLKKRTEIMERYNAASQKQQEVQSVMSKLRAIAFPCTRLEQAPSAANSVSISVPEYYSIVDEMPQFGGGDKALLEFISQNIRYPEELKEANISGMVYVKYTVDPEGFVNDVNLARSSGNQLLDDEAMRVIRMLKGYTPGRQSGEAVPVQFTIPVRFELK